MECISAYNSHKKEKHFVVNLAQKRLLFSSQHHRTEAGLLAAA
jgi:hypothetical protein